MAEINDLWDERGIKEEEMTVETIVNVMAIGLIVLLAAALLISMGLLTKLAMFLRRRMRREDVEALLGQKAVASAEEIHQQEVHAKMDRFKATVEQAIAQGPGTQLRHGAWHGKVNSDHSITFRTNGERISISRGSSEAIDCAPPDFRLPDGWRWDSSLGGWWTMNKKIQE